MTASQRAKVLILGMDCMTPQLVFEQWRDELPTFKSLMEGGIWGRLNSTIPPITVPAWMCMATSKNPGRLGFYGFRNRADYSYERMTIANSKAVTEDTVWDILSRDARRVILIGVPQTYPPKPVNGLVVSDFLTPSTKNRYTYPPELKAEVEEISGGYMLDVENFRTEDKDHLLQQIYLMTEKRIRVVKRLLTTREWDFAMWVEMGPDRIHHGFWKYFDPSHPKHQPGNPYANAIKEYYQYLDREIGQILALVPEETVVIVVSDHGAKRMVGGICINEWLRQEGYLTLREEPNGITPIEKVEIDWGRTKAWGAGGYYGRLFLNVAGREPQGTIPPADYERVREELTAKLEAITDPQGRNIGTRVFTPEKAYGKGYKGIPPDLIIYFGDLDWRSVGSVGHGSAYTFENDLGPDDANHAQEGIFIMHNPRFKARGEIKGLDILDVAPTVLAIYGLPIPPDWEGKVIPGSG
ncbi:MAG: alkaline phosphatase family protein [Chloroflexi bacterium]|nr:alkaline phosphatase family protein [Chloroflexota bacterium]